MGLSTFNSFEIRRAVFIVLVFTPPGEGQLIGRMLDQVMQGELVGTIAGDDTVLCINENEKKARTLEKKFNEMIV